MRINGTLGGFGPVVEALLVAGAELDTRDQDGWTALAWATRLGRPQVRERLRQAYRARRTARLRALWRAVRRMERGRIDRARERSPYPP